VVPLPMEWGGKEETHLPPPPGFALAGSTTLPGTGRENSVMENHMDWRRPFGRRRVAAPESKDSRAGPLIALTGAGRARWTPRDYAHLAAEGFGKNAVAYRCVRMIAEAAASTPLMVMVGGCGRASI